MYRSQPCHSRTPRRSTLIRTVHSIVKRTPPHLLEEIVLLDDASDKDHLGQKLDEYMAKYVNSVERLPDSCTCLLDSRNLFTKIM